MYWEGTSMGKWRGAGKGAGQCSLQATHLITTACPVRSLNSLLALF